MMKASSSFFHRAFIVTWICYASFYLTRKPFSVVKSQLKTELGLSTAELGVIDTSFLAAYAFAQLVLGPLMRRLCPNCNRPIRRRSGDSPGPLEGQFR